MEEYEVVSSYPGAGRLTLSVNTISAATPVSQIVADQSTTIPSGTGFDFPAAGYATVYLDPTDFARLQADVATGNCIVTYTAQAVSSYEEVSNFTSYS